MMCVVVIQYGVEGWPETSGPLWRWNVRTRVEDCVEWRLARWGNWREDRDGALHSGRDAAHEEALRWVGDYRPVVLQSN